MATSHLRRVIQTLRRATLHHEEAGLTDGQLLESYVSCRKEAAFAALVRLHGPMVWGVCRRVLRSHQDAEDAFQATFLVLVRKAASVVPRQMVANWLYGVAHQTALKARATTARRGARERQVTLMPEPALEKQELWDDLQPLLDQELSRLPDKYRAVVALCDLEGRTRKEAARQLHLPEGTVASRLATARAMLAKRLGRHGLGVSGAALAAVLSQQAASASVPLSMAYSTIKAASVFAAGPATATCLVSGKAVALAEGVLKTMLLTKLKIATAVLVVIAVLGAGATALTQRVLAEKPAALASRERERAEVPDEKPADPLVKEKKEPAVKPATDMRELAVQPVKTKKEDEARPEVVNGVVKTVDVGKNAVTVVQKDGEKTFTVSKDASIVIDDKPGQLTGLPAGANVSLSQFVDPNTARSLQAGGRWYFGAPVKAVSSGKNTITIDDREGERTFAVAQDAFVTVDGKPCKLAAVPKGAFVNLGLAADQTTARSIGADGPHLGDCGGSLVKAVDVERNTITFDDKASAAVAGKTFRVAPDANIAIDGKRGKLIDLPPGAYVNLVLSVDQSAALSVHAQGARVGGFEGALVKTVDAERNAITFDDKAPAEVAGKTFRVAPDAGIAIDGKRAKLAEVPAGAHVILGLSVDQQTALSVNAQGPPFLCDCGGSLVKTVDIERNTITFDDKARAEVAGKTFTVAKDANIVIDGKPGKLADVPAGAYVGLSLSVDRQTALSVNAQGPGVGDCGGSLVKAVDVEKNTITFDDKAHPDVAGRTFYVALDANIVIDGKPGKLAEVPAGAFVNLGLCVDRLTARSVSAQGPQVLCDCGGSMVRAVDVEKNTITFDDKARAEVAGKTFTVAADVNIVIDGKPGKLAGLPAGSYVDLRLSVDQKTARHINAQGPRVSGVVKTVDAEKNSIAVGDTIFTVASDVIIAIGDKRAQLSGLPKGTNVNLTLCVDQKTVRMINANAP
jgi:RNA polymerase sigma factor (sigma-70 family)